MPCTLVSIVYRPLAHEPHANPQPRGEIYRLSINAPTTASGDRVNRAREAPRAEQMSMFFEGGRGQIVKHRHIVTLRQLNVS